MPPRSASSYTSRRYFSSFEVRLPLEVDADRVERKITDVLERLTYIPHVGIDSVIDLDKGEDVLVRLVAPNADLATCDRERFRPGDTTFHLDEEEPPFGVSRLDVKALVVRWHLRG